MEEEIEGGPATTHALFDHDRVGEGYASARPHLHPEVFARVGTLLALPARVPRALDVGCGTGLSSVALLERFASAGSRRPALVPRTR